MCHRVCGAIVVSVFVNGIYWCVRIGCNMCVVCVYMGVGVVDMGVVTSGVDTSGL